MKCINIIILNAIFALKQRPFCPKEPGLRKQIFRFVTMNQMNEMYIYFLFLMQFSIKTETILSL